MQNPNYILYFMHFIFKEVPDFISKSLVLCSIHLTVDSFINKAQYDAGFSERLELKDDVGTDSNAAAQM